MPDYQFLLIHSFYTRASEAKGSYSAGITFEPPDDHLYVFHMGEEFWHFLFCLPQSPRLAVPVLICPGFTLPMQQSISQQSNVQQKPSWIFCPQVTLWKLVKLWHRFGVLSINFNVYWRMTWSQARISEFGPAFPGTLMCHGGISCRNAGEREQRRQCDHLDVATGMVRTVVRMRHAQYWQRRSSFPSSRSITITDVLVNSS